MSSKKELLKLDHLKKYFHIKQTIGKKGGYLKAVDDVSLTVYEGEVLGLVGESGCGKSTLGRTILGLQDATGGHIKFKGDNVENLKFKDMKPYRKEMQMIFQDPYASLDPRKTIGSILKAPLNTFGIGEPKNRETMVISMLERVGLTKEYLNKLPHEMSGGQRQRVVLARAIISNPRLVVCDEPVSALDVSVRAQVLNLMKDIQEEDHTAYLFISHDLSTVRYICDRIAVMYLGHIVEIADADELFLNPVHPYTKALLSAIPIASVDEKRNRILLSGDVPSPINPPKGCPFSTRCPKATEECKKGLPIMEDVKADHQVACIHR